MQGYSLSTVRLYKGGMGVIALITVCHECDHIGVKLMVRNSINLMKCCECDSQNVAVHTQVLKTVECFD